MKESKISLRGDNIHINMDNGSIIDITIGITSHNTIPWAIYIYELITGYVERRSIYDKPRIELHSRGILSELEKHFPCVKRIDRRGMPNVQIYPKNVDVHYEADKDIIIIAVKYSDKYNPLDLLSSDRSVQWNRGTLCDLLQNVFHINSTHDNVKDEEDNKKETNSMKIEGTIYFGSNTEISVLKGVIYKIKLYIPSYWKTEDILKIYDAITGYMSNYTDIDIEKITDDDLVPLYTNPILDALEEYYPCIKNIDRTKWNWRRIWAMNMDLHCENDTIIITVNYTDQYNKVPKASVRYCSMTFDRNKIYDIKKSTYDAKIDEYCKSDAETVNEALSKLYAEKYLKEIICKKVGEYYMNDGIEYTFKLSEDPKELKKEINSVFGVPTFEAFDKITDELKDTYIKKNHDYGNSFDKSIDKFGLTAAVVRMSDKMERLSSLLNKDAKVDESIRDTVMDLANYCIMTAMYLDNKKENK